MFSFHRRMQLLLPGETQNLLAVLRKENSHGGRPGSELCGKNVIFQDMFVVPLKKLAQALNGGHSVMELEMLDESFSQKGSTVHLCWAMNKKTVN